MLTSKNEGGIGFLFWNANNDYSKPYAAMPEMRAAKGEVYARGRVTVSRERPPANRSGEINPTLFNSPEDVLPCSKRGFSRHFSLSKEFL